MPKLSQKILFLFIILFGMMSFFSFFDSHSAFADSRLPADFIRHAEKVEGFQKVSVEGETGEIINSLVRENIIPKVT